MAGSPTTRDRLIAAAAETFNRDTYHGTDTNRLARAAGFAPATFYKHFPDKRAAFLAVYREWVDAEWNALEDTLKEAVGDPRAIVDVVVDHHVRWAGLRASLRVLVPVDEQVREFARRQRRRQLDWLARLRGRRVPVSGRHHEPRDLALLLTFERVADAIADGEAAALGVNPDDLRTQLATTVRQWFA
ncbi:TetR/AcrR family transcriptional regulator [Actinoplanes sp. NPDC051346]|uniref:TetR/AcrR family transcriptional regulator n=1 Tax=Actinoplanes sp. NPDC051346 TaxID=3155048 RepID=UPI0034140D6E